MKFDTGEHMWAWVRSMQGKKLELNGSSYWFSVVKTEEELKVVEAIDEAGVHGGEHEDERMGRKLESLSESVRTLCDGVLANPMGFRLSGFVVSPKMVMQVLYAVCSVLFLVLAGGKRGIQV